MKHQFSHYIGLLWRKIWIVLPVMVLVTVAWIVAISKMGLSTPELEARAVLQFDDPEDMSAVEQRIGSGAESKAVLIKSRSFLNDIVQKLSLNFVVENQKRENLFDSISVSPDAALGIYELEINKKSYILHYYLKKGEGHQIVKKGDVTELADISFPGIYFQMTQSFLRKPHDITYRIVRPRDAVDNILDRFTVRTSENDGSIMMISLSGRDYPLITKTINTIADQFVQENSKQQRSRKGEILNVLDNQLVTAKDAMDESEKALRAFRDANPTVGLAGAISDPGSITSLRQNETELRNSVIQARSLMQRYVKIGNGPRIPILNEMIAFMTMHQTGTAEALQTELDILSEDKRRLKEGFSPIHPLVKENQQNVVQFGEKVVSALSDLIARLQQKIKSNESRIGRIQSEIAGLPAKEIEYAKLMRKHEVNSKIYSNVLARYNEAKIAEAVTIGDVFVVDHAVEPEPISDLKLLAMLIGTGIFFGFTVGFGPFLAIDYFDRTARNADDVKRLTNIPVLESIPVKGKWKHPHEGNIPDEKLVSANYSHNFVDETYRALRTKVLLSMYEQKEKRILVTSLNMGEGKSFTTANMAITTAQQKLPTILIDGDLRRGRQHQSFGLGKKPGLSDLLMNNGQLTPSMVKSIIRSTHIPNLAMIPSGTSVPNSGELINTVRFREILDILSREFEMVVVDTPPVAVLTDAISIQDAFHKYIVVVRASHTNITQLDRKINEYPKLREKVLGIVFNGASYKRPEYYQYTSYHY